MMEHQRGGGAFNFSLTQDDDESEPAAPSNRLPVLRSFLCLLPCPRHRPRPHHHRHRPSCRANRVFLPTQECSLRSHTYPSIFIYKPTCRLSTYITVHSMGTQNCQFDSARLLGHQGWKFLPPSSFLPHCNIGENPMCEFGRGVEGVNKIFEATISKSKTAR